MLLAGKWGAVIGMVAAGGDNGGRRQFAAANFLPCHNG